MNDFRDDTLYFKKLTPTAFEPKKGSAGAAGFDLAADLGIGQEITLYPGRRLLISTGIAMASPPHTYVRIAPRSGLATKFGIDVLAGVIDEDYRGEVKVILINLGDEPLTIKHGDRIAQAIVELVVPVETAVVDELPETVRGAGGLGSTGL